MEAKYELYGVTKAYYGMEEEEQLVAKFTTYAKARKYVKDSRLKAPTKDYEFKSGSLLRSYASVFVEPSEEIIEVPVNPEYKERNE